MTESKRQQYKQIAVHVLIIISLTTMMCSDIEKLWILQGTVEPRLSEPCHNYSIHATSFIVQI